MKIMKFLMSTMILVAVLMVVGFPLQQTMAKDNTIIVDISKKSQIPNAKKKSWNFYNNSKSFVVVGKYHSVIENYLSEKIKKTYKLEWIPTLDTESTKSIKQYKEAITYLSKIVSDIREKTNYVMNQYSSYFDVAKINKDAQKALVVADYASKHMTYGFDYTNSDDTKGLSDYRRIYENTYIGVCQDSAYALIDICKALGYKTKFFMCRAGGRAPLVVGDKTVDVGHAWMCIAAVDIDGTKYWQSIEGTAYAYTLTWDSPDNLPYEKDFIDYHYQPCQDIESIESSGIHDPSELGFKLGKKIFGNKMDGEGCIYAKVGDVFEIPLTYGEIVEREGLKVDKEDDVWKITILDVFEYAGDFDESGEEEGSLIVPISIKMPVFYDEEIDPEDENNTILYNGMGEIYLPLSEWDFIVKKS